MGAGASSRRLGVFAKPDKTGEMKGRKRDRAGRQRKSEPFIMLPMDLLVRPVWTNLPAAARVIFLDMCMIHRHGGGHGPRNNGQIGYGCVAGAKAAGVSAATAHRMLSRVRESGLIKLWKEGSFGVKAGERRAREWEITIYPVDGGPPVSWGERRLHIEHRILKCSAYKGLSNPAKCILIELMRRYDGGNNGCIAFGGPSGAHAGFSTDVTERALTELQRAGFIFQTATAIPQLRQTRKWRLTMYAADRRPATKDFMSVAKSMTPQKSFHGFTGAADSNQNVSMMRVSTSSNLPASSAMEALPNKISAFIKDLNERSPILDTRTGETFGTASTRASEIHLETSPPASDTAGSPASQLPLFQHPSPAPTAAAAGKQAWVKGGRSARKIIEQPPGLFGDALPSMPTPLDRLRSELRAVLGRKRGTQSRLIEALGLSRHTFANALSGRERFTASAIAALRGWLDGKPLSEGYPPLPLATEGPDAA